MMCISDYNVHIFSQYSASAVNERVRHFIVESKQDIATGSPAVSRATIQAEIIEQFISYRPKPGF